jgi:hypothetical protein
MNDLLFDRYEEAMQEDFWPWDAFPEDRYGFVFVRNRHYMVDGDDVKYFIRKPTPKERREIIINTIIACNGRHFVIAELAIWLGVSDRTIQTALRKLQKEGLIEIIPQTNSHGAQKSNAYRYIGPPCEKYGSGLTLQLLYSSKRDVGFRDWMWKEYEFFHDKKWHSIYALCKLKFKKRVARRNYLEKNNLPLVVMEDIKYLVLRYCYWKGDNERLRNSAREILVSKDGTIKFALEPLNRTETVHFFGYTLSIQIGGVKENPQITIINADTKEQLGVFSWFEENIIQSSKEIDENHTEQFFILGDFTTR